MNFETISELQAYSLDNSTSGILITDPHGIISYVNSRQCQSSGYDRDELIGRNASIFQSGETPQVVYRDMWAKILSGESWQGELLNRRKNGDEHWEHVFISPVKNHDDAVVAFWAIKEEQYHKYTQAVEKSTLSQIDPMTGIYNINRLLVEIDKAISRRTNQQSAENIILYYVDIDRFHSINQNLGYLAADTILVELARRLRSCFRLNDVVARIGADVFAILLCERENGVQAKKALERLLREIRGAFTVQERQVFVTASIGSVSFPRCGASAEELLENARLAMMAAKNEGGDGYHIFADSRETEKTDSSLANDLLHAIDRNQLELHYQPQINALSGEISGLEALLRWSRNEDGLVPPGIFIPIAEKSELIVSIGEWVLRQAVSQIASWRKQGLADIRVAINLSAKHFHRSDLVPYIKQLLHAADVEPELLELELTEGAVLQNPVKVKQNISDLKSLGVHISLDDFGTGHSSLVWLSQLPVDQIKIDKSFVFDVAANPVNASIVSATIAMAEKLDKDSIAEGVETEAQLHFLRRHGCDFLQGFLFSKPLPVEQITSLLRQEKKWSFADLSPDQDLFTLLVVDDEPQIVHVLKRLFRRGEYRVLSAASGREALEVLALNQVHVVISDHLMPGMTGVEMLATIKKLYPDTVRIILSGQSNVSTIIEAINQGAIWKYFTKPIETELLRNSVRKACRKMLTQNPPF